MTASCKKFKLRYYDKVISRKVNWLWYPYIPYGKITIVQGDPGEGKTTFVLNLVSKLTLGQSLYNDKDKKVPQVVIYQSAEDGVEDTIKSRLEATGADCTKVVYLEYDGNSIALNDERIEQAIIKSGAKLLVFDPLPAFIGDADMNRAGDIRVLMQKLAAVADRTGCAIILVGHMNKAATGKSIYRGLGSIDIAAVARSVLLIGRIKDNQRIRAVVHIKSNLAPEGKSIAFELSEEAGFGWIDDFEITQEELLSDAVSLNDNKTSDAIRVISELLTEKPMLAVDIFEACEKSGISVRTAKTAKNIIGVKSIKSKDKWYWELPISVIETNG